MREACSSFKALEVARKNIKLLRIVGHGQFGNIYQAELKLYRHERVAVKTSRDLAVQVDAAAVASEEALQLEARLLHQLRHPHIVQVLAVVTMSLPTWIGLEFMQNGDLKTYLRLIRVGCGVFFSPIFLL